MKYSLGSPISRSGSVIVDFEVMPERGSVSQDQLKRVLEDVIKQGNLNGNTVSVDGFNFRQSYSKQDFIIFVLKKLLILNRNTEKTPCLFECDECLLHMLVPFQLFTGVGFG